MLGIDFFNKFSLRPYKENRNRLSSFCPWSYPVGKENEGIILLKPGALMRAYSFVCPDLGSSSAETIQSVSFFFNEAIRQLGNDWGCQFESQRVLCGDYPGTDWEDEAGYLIDRHRQKLFQEKDSHFLNYYFLILTMNLPSEIYSKAKGFLYKKDSDEGEGWFNLETCEKEIQAFRDTTSGIMSHLTGHISFRALGNDEVATLCHNSVSSRHHKVVCPKNPTFFDYYITDDNLKIASTFIFPCFPLFPTFFPQNCAPSCIPSGGGLWGLPQAAQSPPARTNPPGASLRRLSARVPVPCRQTLPTAA